MVHDVSLSEKGTSYIPFRSARTVVDSFSYKGVNGRLCRNLTLPRILGIVSPCCLRGWGGIGLRRNSSVAPRVRLGTGEARDPPIIILGIGCDPPITIMGIKCDPPIIILGIECDPPITIMGILCDPPIIVLSIVCDPLVPHCHL